MSENPPKRHPGGLTKQEFIGAASINDSLYSLNGRAAGTGLCDENHAHLWEAAEDVDNLGPVRWRGEGDQADYSVRHMLDWEPEGTMVLFAPDGKACGFYMRAMCWVDEDHRGKGLSTPLILECAKELGGSPTQNDGVVGFTEAGYTAHERAWETAKAEFEASAQRAWGGVLMIEKGGFHPGSLDLKAFMGDVQDVDDKWEIDGEDEGYEDIHELDLEECPMLWRGEGDLSDYSIHSFEGYEEDGVVLVDNDMVYGFYMGGRCWLDEHVRGKGLSVPLILMEAMRTQSSPLKSAEYREFSPAGYKAHLRAWQVARQDCGASDEIDLEYDSLVKADPVPRM
jgi:GNAT superfamily N-acetyltransferase